MIPAFLNGKLSREQENMEDILTSIVFGVLQYVPPSKGIFPLLNLVEQSDSTQTPLRGLWDDSSVDYSFWESMKELHTESGIDCEYCEPDLLLRISKSNGEKLVVLIEAKLWSGKSSFAGEEEKKQGTLIAL